MYKMRANIKLLFIYLFVVSLIYQSGSVRAALLREGMLFQTTRILMLAIPICFLMKYRCKKNILSYMGTCLLIGIPAVWVNYILYSDGALQFVYKIFIFTLSGAFYISLLNKKINLNHYIYQVIIMLAAITLIFYFMTEIMKLPLPHSVVYRGNSYRYYDYFEIFFTYHYNNRLPRLSGLFWEPGAYQIYLNWGLFLYIFEERGSKKDLFVLLISILLTQSTSGYCIAALLMVVLISKTNYLSKKSRALLGIGGIIVASVFSAFVIYKKIQKTGNDIYGSAFLRFSDIKNGISILFRHPLIGIGFGNEMQFMELDAHGRGSSNGLISYTYMTGIVGLVMALYPFLKNLCGTLHKQRQWVWIIMIIIFNSTEPIYNLPIMAYILAVEYVYALEKTRMGK